MRTPSRLRKVNRIFIPASCLDYIPEESSYNKSVKKDSYRAIRSGDLFHPSDIYFQKKGKVGEANARAD